MALNPAGADWTRPPRSCFPITPGATRLAHMIRGVSFDTDGEITFTDHEGTSCTTSTLAAGVIHPLATEYITAATVTGLVGWWG